VTQSKVQAKRGIANSKPFKSIEARHGLEQMVEFKQSEAQSKVLNSSEARRHLQQTVGIEAWLTAELKSSEAWHGSDQGVEVTLRA
jgi:hypothetical protein